MSEESTLLQAVAEAARLGGARALEHSRSALAVETKADGSPVTAADRDVELLMREWIAARFPRDGILGEEFPEHNRGADLRWIVDPIDGTRSFVRGAPEWGTLVAVARGEDVVAGAIHCPAVNELVCAARGEGCWWNDARCRVSAVADLTRASMLEAGDCHSYLLVATGRADVMVDRVMSPWDAAALMPVIQEAGGVITDWSGCATAFGGSIIATNAALAREARTLLRAGAPR